MHKLLFRFWQGPAFSSIVNSFPAVRPSPAHPQIKDFNGFKLLLVGQALKELVAPASEICPVTALFYRLLLKQSSRDIGSLGDHFSAKRKEGKSSLIMVNATGNQNRLWLFLSLSNRRRWSSHSLWSLTLQAPAPAGPKGGRSSKPSVSQSAGKWRSHHQEFMWEHFSTVCRCQKVTCLTLFCSLRTLLACNKGTKCLEMKRRGPQTQRQAPDRRLSMAAGTELGALFLDGYCKTNNEGYFSFSPFLVKAKILVGFLSVSESSC